MRLVRVLDYTVIFVTALKIYLKFIVKNEKSAIIRRVLWKLNNIVYNITPYNLYSHI